MKTDESTPEGGASTEDSGNTEGTSTPAAATQIEHATAGDTDRVDRSVVVSSWFKQMAQWSLRLLIIGLTAFVVWYFLEQLWAGIMPMLIALIVCTVLAPPTTWMRQRGVPPALAAITSVLLFFGAIGALLAVIAPNIISQSRLLYVQVAAGIGHLQLWLQEQFSIDLDTVDQFVNDIASWLQNYWTDIAGTVFSGLSTATSLVITLFMILVLVVFFLKDGHHFLPWLRSVLGQRAGWHSTELLTRGWTVLGGYIRAQAIVSAVDATFIGMGLWLLDVPIAMTLGLITFIAGFIPFVGAITAGALAVIIALVSQGFTTAVLALVLVLAVQQLEGNILSPLLQSRAMNLHPVIILVSVVVGGGLFGLVGAFLAVPVAAMIAVLFRYFLDITTLQTGEKTADDIEFITPEGKATGRINEERGRVLRSQWRKDSEFLAAAVAEYGAEPAAKQDEQADGGSYASRSKNSRFHNGLHSGTLSLEHLIGGKH